MNKLEIAFDFTQSINTTGSQVIVWGIEPGSKIVIEILQVCSVLNSRYFLLQLWMKSCQPLTNWNPMEAATYFHVEIAQMTSSIFHKGAIKEASLDYGHIP